MPLISPFISHCTIIRIHPEDRCAADSVDPDMPETMQRLSLISTSLPNFNCLLKPYPEPFEVRKTILA